MKKTLFFSIIFAVALCFNVCAYARNDVSMMKGDQDYLILGSVKDIVGDDVIITVDHVLGQTNSKLVGKDISVKSFTYSYCELHTNASFNMPVISDNIVISLDLNGNKYVLKNGSYKVDSNDYATCRIISHVGEDARECILELAEITCYIRSDSKVNGFEYDSEGNIFAVYPQKPEHCIVSVDNTGNAVANDENNNTMSEPGVVNAHIPQEETVKKDFKWLYAIGIFILGTAGGLLFAYLYLQRKSDIDK